MQVSSFTLKFPSKAREIITDVSVYDSIYMDVEDKSDERVVHTKALWDTGATNCVITPSCAKLLGIKPVGMTNTHHAGGISVSNVYLINVILPNNVKIENVRFTECSEQGGSFGVIIGMDIITKGDFSITNVGGNTVFSFRTPSMRTIDFVDESRKIGQVQSVLKNKKIGRNEPCPCGSGKKYKNCHGK